MLGIFAKLSLLIVCLGACATGGGSGTSWATSFEDDAVGDLPRGFVVAETNGAGTPASWRVQPGIDPDDPGQVVGVEAASAGQTYNLLLTQAAHPADFSLSVYLIPRSGAEDQGGGLVWRARDADNYYVARWNPLEDNVRLYTVVDGNRSMLGSADVVARPQMWHHLQVRMHGDAITVSLDGKARIEVRDMTFADGGPIGLWTKADASTLFDQIELSTTE